MEGVSSCLRLNDTVEQMRIAVQTYAGYKGDERPVSFSRERCMFRIMEIVDRLYDPDYNCFKVLADDGRTYLLQANYDIRTIHTGYCPAQKTLAPDAENEEHTRRRAEKLMEKPAFPLKVFYDGACIVCSTEMQVYRRKNHEGRLVFIDISVPEFDPAPYGISREEFMAQMHAIDREGTVFRAVDAFRAIWQAFPASTFYGALGTIIALPGITTLARMGYRLFARYRKYLPRRRRECDTGTCTIRNGQ